ncbi:sodium/hydrogen exchanger 9B2-like isoform X2 [Cimex lectularius]|uniref:Cation/H+ exchanger transmembrane domain-containing protein n=1 Tax=Cimex lectularius TaxID=79782 RepID=A0A8I6SU62_CIMLE|nr:sodium/hydrogen exchanger 9B2-like isoform X2 [Cimex lectularius]
MTSIEENPASPRRDTQEEEDFTHASKNNLANCDTNLPNSQSKPNSSPKEAHDSKDTPLNSEYEIIFTHCSGFGRSIQNQMGLKDSQIIFAIGAVIIGLLIWGILYGVVLDEVAPGGDLFQILVLVVSAYLAGKVVGMCHLPPLLGMLTTGIAMRSVGFFEISGVYPDLVTKLRETALTVILIKAGLGLDAVALMKLSLVVLRLAILPCIAEAVAAAVFSYFILDYPILWGLLLGFMLSAVSPAVVVPTLLSLKEKGYGENKGISTLVIAASSLDDIVAISVFGVFLSIIFSPAGHQDGKMLEQLSQGPIEMLLGLVLGIFWGLVAAFIPHKDDKQVVTKRVLMIGCGGLCAVLGGEVIHYSGAGPLACIVSAFTASLAWKIQGWSTHHPVVEAFGTIWTIIQPMLFGLIGAEVDVKLLHADTILKGIAVICGALVIRVICCCVVLLGSKLNWKEIIFVNLAWLPKATVQAALGPDALELATRAEEKDEQDILRGHQLLTLAVLSILMTAPVGAIGISTTGPYLLSNVSVEPEAEENIESADTAMHMSEGTQLKSETKEDAASKV